MKAEEAYMTNKEQTIAFFDTKPYDSVWFNKRNESYGYAIKYFPIRLNADTAALANGFDVVCAFVNDEISQETADILVAGGVRLLALRCAGYNNVNLEAVWGRLHVVRVPSYSPHAVAEHALALLFSLNRKTHKAYIRTRDGNFTLNGLSGFDLFNKTAGIIGTGQIGRIAAKALAGLGMHVLVSDPRPDSAWAEQEGVQYVSNEELFAQSDVISLHCPLTPETKHLINEESLSLMKPKTVIINTGRGGLIDSKALITALKEQRIGGAGLDVYEEEDQYFFEDHSSTIIMDDVLARLLTFPNVLITSHQAFLTEEALSAIAATTLENVRLFFEEGKTPNEICYRCASKTCTRKETGRCF
jgi:D-lactate dehydrogenase